ncbi:MAG: hypothetical protein AAF518_26030 [Spirochaetota bacterium]
MKIEIYKNLTGEGPLEYIESVYSNSLEEIKSIKGDYLRLIVEYGNDNDDIILTQLESENMIADEPNFHDDRMKS